MTSVVTRPALTPGRLRPPESLCRRILHSLSATSWVVRQGRLIPQLMRRSRFQTPSHLGNHAWKLPPPNASIHPDRDAGSRAAHHDDRRGGLAMAVDSPLRALFPLVVIRMAMDACAHVREHWSPDHGVDAGYPEDPRVRQGNRNE